MKGFRVLSMIVLLVFVLSQVVACGPTASPSEAEPTAAAAEPTAEADEPTAEAAEPTAVAAEPTAEAAEPTAEAAPESTVHEFVGLVRNHPASLDPAIGTDNPSWKFYVGSYEGLLDVAPATTTLVPALAESWEASEDGTLFTFKLREGVKFHDGTTLDAEDVKVSIERIKEVNLGPAWALADLSEIRIVDPMTVELVLDKPSFPFLDAIPMFYIVSSEAVKEHEVDGDLAQGWLAEHEAGTGPYMLESWTLGEELALTRFDDYWQGWEENQIDRVVLRLVEEAATQSIMMEAGEGNWGDSITLQDAEKFAQDSRFNVVFHPALGLMWFSMNTTKPPLDNVKLRQAIRAAFDYKAMAEDIMMGRASIPRGYLDPAYADHDPSIPEETQDMAKAKELMAEAGYPDGGLTLDLIYFGPLDWERRGSELLQSNLAELGITLNISGETWATMVEKAANPDSRPDMMYWTASGETGSPDSTFSQTFGTGSTHWSNFGYSNPELDTVIHAATIEPDPEKRKELYYQAQQILQADSPAINSVIEDWHHVFSANVTGYQIMTLRYAAINYYWLRMQ